MDITHIEFLNTYKLMTGVDITLGRYCDIFISAAAASQALDSTGALIKVDHKMEEIDELTAVKDLAYLMR